MQSQYRPDERGALLGTGLMRVQKGSGVANAVVVVDLGSGMAEYFQKAEAPRRTQRGALGSRDGLVRASAPARRETRPADISSRVGRWHRRRASSPNWT